ncbi:unnamed protein product [Gongylonema pulchrum]|uniref:Rho-GAP domain-containing protein n=1 Tax=Gongylonema pulchrum TaxID=637853 RepID=A0A183DLX9_9BILA|nr:unnamed protein product [Gongylonema pulchrum]
MSILVGLCPIYGILWHPHRNLIIVPPEHLNPSVELGSWVMTQVSTLETDIPDLPYDFITVSQLKKIADKLQMRRVGNAVQVGVLTSFLIEKS